jgi:hypothetical protein
MCYTANYTSALVATDCTLSEMSNDIRNHHDEVCSIVFWRDDDIQTLVRAPLSLESYATRALLRRGLPNVGPETIPRHLCEELDKIRNIHGK